MPRLTHREVGCHLAFRFHAGTVRQHADAMVDLTLIRTPVQIAVMLDEASVEAELVVYQLKLMKLVDRFGLGERSSLLVASQACEDALICLVEEAPSDQRKQIEYLAERFGALRLSCLN